MISFNKPYLTGNELKYIQEAVKTMKISGDGVFTKKCHEFFESQYLFKKCLLTTSCTDALEMAALLLNIKDGDEVIAPSFTFVSTVNAFILRGAKIVFADSSIDNPNIDVNKLEELITSKTKAIVPVHYAGVACNMDKIIYLAKKHNLYIVEDAAQAIDSYYLNKPLGSLGHLAAFSFHETKNIISGEGGMLVINEEKFIERAEIIREKGTNRAQFFRGEIDKYSWVDLGSSFLPSDIIAAFLYAQLENLNKIQMRRLEIWNKYYLGLKDLKNVGVLLPVIPEYATNNGHMFYFVCNNLSERTKLIEYLRNNGIYAVFHYQSLHKSEYAIKNDYRGLILPNADRFTDCLVRLPLYYEIMNEEVDFIIKKIKIFYNI